MHETKGRRRWARQSAAICLAGLSVAAGSSGTPHHQHDSVHLGELEDGLVPVTVTEETAVFWSTAQFDCPEACGEVGKWDLEVGGSGMLEVALYWPYMEDDLALEVRGSGVDQRESNTFIYYTHVFEFEATPGEVVEITVHGNRTAGPTTARLRALVHPVEDRHAAAEALLPNLRAMPPFEFGFTAPAFQMNGNVLVYTGARVARSEFTGSRVLGQNVQSCTADEMMEKADPTQTREPRPVARCLRFTTGPENHGPGHLDLRFPYADRARSESDRILEMTQVIHHADGTQAERDAGTFEFHASHAHFHHDDTMFYELLAVDPSTGEVTELNTGEKSGFCPVDLGVSDFSAFGQAEQDTIAQLHRQQGIGNCGGFSFGLDLSGGMGITAGWADLYSWSFGGQFVDFTGQPDGRYVVRVIADIDDWVLETDETDNASYALVEVVGDEVTILERGYGLHHLDPAKEVVDDGRGQRPVVGIDGS